MSGCRVSRIFFQLLVLSLGISGCPKRVEKPAAPAVVIIARRVRTLDAQNPVAQAIAMKNGKIIKVGSREQALQAAGKGALVEEFPSGVIVPGFVEAHGHLEWMGETLTQVSLGDARDETVVVAKLKQAPAESRQGDWILATGWNETTWPTGELPTRWSLDAAFDRAPVFLKRSDGHTAWVNGEALRRAGIRRDTRDPPGGKIVRDSDGEPTGILIDNALHLVRSHIPEPSPEQRQRRLKHALEMCARLGITSVHDAGENLATFEQLQRWDMGGVLPIKVYAMAQGQGDERDLFVGRGTFKGKNLVMRAVKLFADGAFASRGAALLEPYADRPSESGFLLLKPEVLEQRALAFSERGFQVAIHAIGDKAASTAVDVLTQLPKEGRHRVEHAALLKEADIERMGESSLVASMQPSHLGSHLETRLGKPRAASAQPWRSLLQAGVHLAFGSDFPAAPANPLRGLYAARTRCKTHSDDDKACAQNVSAQEALAAYTSGGAFAEFAEDRRGALKEGFEADFVLLDVDPVEDPAEALLDAKVLMTVVDGLDIFRHTSLRSE